MAASKSKKNAATRRCEGYLKALGKRKKAQGSKKKSK